MDWLTQDKHLQSWVQGEGDTTVLCRCTIILIVALQVDVRCMTVRVGNSE